MMRRNLPLGATVKPTESSAERKRRYASSAVMSCGAMMVTFLLLAGMVPGSTNCRQVIDEIHEMRSPRSVSGFRFNFTIRLLGGNFLHELNSFSPARSPVAGAPAAPGAPGVAADGGGVAPVGLPNSDGAPVTPAAAARFARRSWRADGDRFGGPFAGGGVGGGAGGVAAAGGVGVPAPETTAARASAGAI